MGEQSLFCASVENHHRHLRHSLSGFFNMESLVSSVRMFDGLTVEAMSKWKPGETVVVYKDALKITFRTVCKMLMSLDREDELDEMQGDVFEITEAVLAFPLKLPGTRFFKGLKARERVMSKLREIIRLRREGLGCHEDFLQSLLMKAECSSDDSLTDSQIEDNILTLLISGHATSASAMTWMVKYLDENQEVQEKLRELHLRLACSSPKMSLGPEAFSEMPYGSKVVKEALRMSSVVSWFPRIALQDCEIDGFHIRRGWIVNVDARHIHYDPAVYKDPTKFYPSRFNEDPKPYSFLVYGTGERTCLGINLAKYMMLAFLHRLVTTFRWKVMDPDTSLVKQALVPRLRSGCPITVTPIKV
uniref:Abscisic acid 8'-hydroxylase 2 n=1 Tax=Anthurium amnicola TaxID=1678845 RepID=A0A1D1YWV0_9ARAE